MGLVLNQRVKLWLYLKFTGMIYSETRGFTVRKKCLVYSSYFQVPIYYASWLDFINIFIKKNAPINIITQTKTINMQLNVWWTDYPLHICWKSKI